jgi:signal transduction histidine kinase
VPDEPVELRADHHRLQQALTNLVVNAVQAMPAGGCVSISVERRHARPPSDHGGPEGEWLCVAVQDDGVGIPPEHLGRIFEPFFTTKDVGDGTGLGLAVTWGIVHEHGGWIAVESEVGRGSCFRILLPPLVAVRAASA